MRIIQTLVPELKFYFRREQDLRQQDGDEPDERLLHFKRLGSWDSKINQHHWRRNSWSGQHNIKLAVDIESNKVLKLGTALDGSTYPGCKMGCYASENFILQVEKVAG